MAKRKITFDDISHKLRRNDILGSEHSVDEYKDLETLNLWLEIFPDAEPEYFYEKYIEIKDNEDRIEEFIVENLEKRNYPKLVDSRKNTVDNGEKKFYREEYSVEKFLERFPDAVKYFLDEKRVSSIPREQAVAYAKNRFPNHKLSTIRQCIDSTKNFALACVKLSQVATDRAQKRPLEEHETLKDPSLEFLQETAFIEHYNEIFDYIEVEQARRRLAYSEAQRRGELVECGCCYDDVLFEESTVCEEGDIFCKNCVRKGAEVRIGEGHTTFPCLKDCGVYFSLDVLQTVLHESVFSKLLKRKQIIEVQAAGIVGLESCPFCEFATIPSPESRIFTCLNPECGKESCRFCQRVSHVPLRCEEVESDNEVKMRTYIENKMTEALVRTCWKCKAQFVKENGCNKMQCACGAKMCYVCRKPVVGYTHFANEEGAVISKIRKCPLYSSDKVLHSDVIKAVGEQAKKRLGINSSNALKNDPTNIKIVNRGIIRSANHIHREDVNGLKERIFDAVFGNNS